MIESMQRGEIAVIPGFQGISADGRVTTLGRGGSDTAAVAVAAATKADRCDLYTDVDGVYTTAPRLVAKAHKPQAVNHEGMLELAQTEESHIGKECVRKCGIRGCQEPQ